MSRQKIRVLFARNPPDAFDNCHQFPTLQPYTRCPFPGWCVEILKHLVDFLHYDIEPIIATSKVGHLDWGAYKNDTWSGALGYLSNDTADVVCLFYQRTELRAQHFNFSYPVINVSPNYIVRTKKNDLSSNIWNAFTPYDLIIWMSILIFLILQIAYLLFVARTEKEMGRRTNVDFPKMIWDLFRLQLYQPFQVDFYTLGGNLTILVFSLLQCRLFLDMYQNVLLSALLKPTTEQPFNNANELLDLIGQNKYKLITNYHGNWYFEELETSNNPRFLKLREAITRNSIKVVPTVEQALKEVSTGNFIFPIQEDSIAALYAKERCDLTHVENGVTEKSAHFVFRQNSPFLEPFNNAIIQNLDFVRRTFDKYFKLGFKISKRTVECNTDDKTNLKNSQKSLDMGSLFGVIVICFVGLILSLVAFAAEFYISWQHKMILLRLQSRRALMDPLHLMAIANFRTSRSTLEEEPKRSEFLKRPIKIFPSKKKERLIQAFDEDDV